MTPVVEKMAFYSMLASRAKYRSITYISTKPALYYGTRRLLGRTDALCVRRDTDIVIEGFPRSSNSTTVQNFISRQSRELHVAHHKHHAAQILRAGAWGIPAIVLIREPRAACLSVLALRAEVLFRRGHARSQEIKFIDAFASYCAFYEAVQPLLDKVVIGRFDAVTESISPTIAKVNRKFDTSFQTQRTDSSSLPKLGWHALPNATREEIKRKMSRAFGNEYSSSDDLRRLVGRAERIYTQYLKADERNC